MPQGEGCFHSAWCCQFQPVDLVSTGAATPPHTPLFLDAEYTGEYVHTTFVSVGLSPERGPGILSL